MLGLINLFRPKNAIAPVLWLFIGYGASSADQWKAAPLQLCTFGILLLNFFATAQNDIEDLDIDSRSGRSSALIGRQVSVEKLKAVSYALAAIAIITPLLF